MRLRFQFGLYQRLLWALAVLLINPLTADAAPDDLATWHLPLPAGEWGISRGPCGSTALFTHDCGFYENQCAVDLVPLAGSIENAPVLAPQAGEVLFIGARSETGQMLLLLHPDGRVSGYMHLSRVVVALDEAVQLGQVLGYAGASGNVRPHLHFWIQPNAVERTCEALHTIDVLNYRDGRATSRNLPWTALTLTDPPTSLPDWLPTLAGVPTAGAALPRRVVLAPGAQLVLPVAVRGAFTPDASLRAGPTSAALLRRSPDYAVFGLPLVGGAVGERTVALSVTGRLPVIGRLPLTTRAGAAALTAPPTLAHSPELVSPTGWTFQDATPELCWRVNYGRVAAPRLRGRVLILGPVFVDSGWLNQACWTPPPLPAGRYLWKVYIRDEANALNRPTQRPWAFVMR